MIRGPAYSKIESEMIISDLAGLKENDIKEYFKTKEEVISSARVILSPFWVFKVPIDKTRIEVKFEYE